MASHPKLFVGDVFVSNARNRFEIFVDDRGQLFHFETLSIVATDLFDIRNDIVEVQCLRINDVVFTYHDALSFWILRRGGGETAKDESIGHRSRWGRLGSKTASSPSSLGLFPCELNCPKHFGKLNIARIRNKLDPLRSIESKSMSPAKCSRTGSIFT
jgi:hypothetical protein